LNVFIKKYLQSPSTTSSLETEQGYSQIKKNKGETINKEKYKRESKIQETKGSK